MEKSADRDLCKSFSETNLVENDGSWDSGLPSISLLIGKSGIFDELVNASKSWYALLCTLNLPNLPNIDWETEKQLLGRALYKKIKVNVSVCFCCYFACLFVPFCFSFLFFVGVRSSVFKSTRYVLSRLKNLCNKCKASFMSGSKKDMC